MKKARLLCCLAMALLVILALFSCGDTAGDTDTETNAPVSESFTVTFSQGDGYPDVVKTVEKGATLTDIPTPKRVTGYELSWEDKDLTDIQGNIFVSVVKKPIKYTIEYVLNGGTNDTNNIDVYDVNTEFTFAKAVQLGYTFKGWYSDENLTERVTEIIKGTTGNITLFAKWEVRITNTVVFESEGGTVVEPQEVDINGKATEPTPPTKAGYTFDGWYNGSDKWQFSMYAVTNPMTLYAKWIANENTLILDGNGSTGGTMSSIKVTTHGVIITPNCEYVKAGYKFIGWSTTPDGEVEYVSGDSYEMGTDSQYTLYAIWGAKENTVKFDGNGATSGSLEDVTAKTHETIILPNSTFEKPGYTFSMWSDGVRCYNEGSEYIVGTNSEITIYAVWEANKNTLKFVGNGHTSGSMDDITIATDQSRYLPTVSYQKNGYVFAGWSTTVNGEIEYKNGATYTMGANETYILYAQWIEASVKEIVSSTMKQYEGKTVNVLATTWTNGEAGAPWAQVELCVEDWDLSANGFGYIINNGVMERNEAIYDQYGVRVNWVSCGGASMNNRLVNAAMNKGMIGEEVIHVALPHTFETMTLLTNETVYDMNGSNYIDFNEDYFNKDSVEQYTLAGHTFFVGGDISFLDEQTAYVLYFNEDMAKEEFGSAFPNLYAAALDGTWTIDTLYDLAGSVSKNLDGNSAYTDNDMYGLGTTNLVIYYQYFGTYQVGKTKNAMGNEVFALTIQNENVNTIISKMLYAQNNPSSIRTSWGSWSSVGQAFAEDRLLFYNEILQKVFTMGNDVGYSILPFPKLSTEQDRYYVPFATQATVACIPRATDDRVLSECMITILSETARDYVTPAYLETIGDNLSSNYSDKSMEILEKEIFPNLMYDLGYTYGQYAGDGNGLVTSSIQASSIVGNSNYFIYAYAEGRTQAESKLAEWSTAYRNYED